MDTKLGKSRLYQRAIVAAPGSSPQGGTDVSETPCPVAKQADVAVAAQELAGTCASSSNLTTWAL